MPNIAPYGTNAFAVQTPGLDYTVADAPTTKTYHGASIVVDGNIIGRITNWQASGAYNRTVNLVRELSHVTFGRPVDIVPAIAEGYTISFTRVEIWSQELELTLGYPAVWDDLADQDRPFTVNEYLFRGNTLYRVWRYSGCWFTDRNESEMAADGDGIVRATCSLMYVQRSRAV